jgi:hypothetical protein
MVPGPEDASLTPAGRPLVQGNVGTDKNTQLTLLSQVANTLALTERNALFACIKKSLEPLKILKPAASLI